MPILWKAGRDFEMDWSVKLADGSYAKVAKPIFDGAVLGVAGETVQVMSDIWEYFDYAKVWDGARVKNVVVGRDGRMDADVVVDAGPAVLVAVAAYEAALAAAAAKAARLALVDKKIADARRVAKGKDIVVTRGRKVKIGTLGRVFWVGDSKFGMRVGLELPDGARVFTALGNVEVANPDDDLDVDALMALAA